MQSSLIPNTFKYLKICIMVNRSNINILTFVMLINIISCTGTLPSVLDSNSDDMHISQSDREEISNDIRPNNHIVCFDNNNYGFIEYCLPTENHESVFKAFGTNQRDAIQLLRQMSKKKDGAELREIISKAIKYDSQDKKLMCDIFNNSIPSEDRFDKLGVQERYLNYYAKPGTMIKCAIDRGINNNKYSEKNKHYTLLNAFAYLYNKNLAIYEKDTNSLEHKLKDLHKFYLKPEQPSAEIIRLVLEHGHYNRLIAVVYTGDQIKNFLKASNSKYLLPSCKTYKHSQEQAYRYLEEQERKPTSDCMLRNATLIARARLLLEQAFTPSGKNTRELIKDIKDKLKEFTSKNQSNDPIINLFSSYSWIYLGKAQRALGKFKKAYNSWLKVDTCYIQLMKLNLAEMMLEDRFIPEDIENDELLVKKYIQSLLLNYKEPLIIPHLIKTQKINNINGEYNEHEINLDSHNPIDRISNIELRSSKKRKREQNEFINKLDKSRKSTRKIDVATIKPTMSKNPKADSNSTRNGYWPSQSSNKRQRPSSPRTVKIEKYTGLIINLNILPISLKETRSWLQESSEQENECQKLILQGKVEVKFHNNKKAIEYYLNALELAKKINAESLKAQAYIDLGNVKYKLSDDMHISDWYINAAELLGPEGNKNLLVKAYIGLCNIRHVDKIYPKNYKWYFEAEKLLSYEINNQRLVQIYIGLGDALLVNKCIEVALDYYQKAIELTNSKTEKNNLQNKIVSIRRSSMQYNIEQASH